MHAPRLAISKHETAGERCVLTIHPPPPPCRCRRCPIHEVPSCLRTLKANRGRTQSSSFCAHHQLTLSQDRRKGGLCLHSNEPRMRSDTLSLRNGEPHSFYFPEDHPSARFSGLVSRAWRSLFGSVVCGPRGRDLLAQCAPRCTSDSINCCCWRILFLQPRFRLSKVPSFKS